MAPAISLFGLNIFEDDAFPKKQHEELQ